MNLLEVVPTETLTRTVKLLFVATGVYFGVRLLEMHPWFFSDAEAFTGLIHISGTLYSVLYAFATYVIWGQFVAVENEILKESGALKDLIVFSRPLSDSVRESMVRAVKAYGRAVAESEWLALSAGESTENTDRLFLAVVSSVTEMKPADDDTRVIYARLLEIANQASTHRNERIALSKKRMPQTLLTFVMMTAGMIFLLILCYPYHNAVLGLAAVLITTALLFFAHFVLTDLDNPFEGTWNVTPECFSDLVPRAR